MAWLQQTGYETRVHLAATTPGVSGAFLDEATRPAIRAVALHEVDRSGRISRCGDRLARTLLYEAAVVLLTRVKQASSLKDWAQAIAKRSGPGKARVALARKLSVSGEPLGSTILHSIWRSGELFR